MGTATRLTDYGSIAFMDAVEGVAIVWNGGATFNVMLATGSAGWWDNVDCFTVYGVEDIRDAQRAADAWFADSVKGGE